MAIHLFQVDKAGDDSLTKDYSISVVLNKEKVFGYRIPQKIQDRLISEFKKGELGINPKDKLRFKLRFHTAIIILIIKEIVSKFENSERYHIELCNDYDGHLHEIREMLFNHLRKFIGNLNKEDIVRQKFDKESLVNKSANYIYRKDMKNTKNYEYSNFKIEDLRELIKKSGNQG